MTRHRTRIPAGSSACYADIVRTDAAPLSHWIPPITLFVRDNPDAAAGAPNATPIADLLAWRERLNPIIEPMEWIEVPPGVLDPPDPTPGS